MKRRDLTPPRGTPEVNGQAQPVSDGGGLSPNRQIRRVGRECSSRETECLQRTAAHPQAGALNVFFPKDLCLYGLSRTYRYIHPHTSTPCIGHEVIHIHFRLLYVWVLPVRVRRIRLSQNALRHPSEDALEIPDLVYIAGSVKDFDEDKFSVCIVAKDGARGIFRHVHNWRVLPQHERQDVFHRLILDVHAPTPPSQDALHNGYAAACSQLRTGPEVAPGPSNASS